MFFIHATVEKPGFRGISTFLVLTNFIGKFTLQLSEVLCITGAEWKNKIIILV